MTFAEKIAELRKLVGPGSALVPYLDQCERDGFASYLDQPGVPMGSQNPAGKHS